MSFRVNIDVRAGRSGIATVLPLLLFALLMAVASGAQAQTQVDCSAPPYNGVIDGNVRPVPPTNVKLDTHCTILNYPGGMSTNFTFDNNDPTPYLVVFDNVVHTGNMSCNAVAQHKIWFTNGSSTTIQDGCQNYLIPVEKIDKRSPAPYAAVGVPFTYRLTIPVLFDPATGTVIRNSGSVNDLHTIRVVDNLNEMGVDVALAGTPTVTWLSSGTPVPHTYTEVGEVLTFNVTPIIPADTQIAIDIPLVLEDTPTNFLGRTFVNIARWSFGRAVDVNENGVIDPDEFFSPLPGENGISQPMTIGAPSLTLTKSGPATMNLGPGAQFTLDATNNGTSAAWNVTIVDRLPTGPTGGMCEVPPAQVNVTLGGTPLVQGTHYALSYAGAPTCELTLSLLDAAGPAAPGQHLIVTYRAQLDTNTQNGATLTNVAAATQWSTDGTTNSNRTVFNRTLTNGTEGTLDHEDSHTVSVALTGNFFEKTVTNLRTGQNPATVAAPGDILRYTLRLQTTTSALSNARIYDEIDALNTPAAIVPGSLSIISPLPAGAVNNTNPNAGAKGTGVIDISNVNVPAGSQISIQFEVRVAAGVAAGSIVSNQAQLSVNGTPLMVSDDPYVNGQSDPLVAGDEDPTRVAIAVPTLLFHKTAISGATAHPADVVRYRLQITNLSNVPAFGFSILDELDMLNASAMFVPGTLTLATALPAGASSNSNANGGSKGTGVLDVRNLTLGVAGSATESVTLEFTAQLVPVIANGTIVLNQGQLFIAGAELQRSDDPAVGGTQDPTGIAIESAPVFRVQKISQDVTNDPNLLLAGETLRYTITVKNIGNADATDAVLRDQVPVNTTYVAGSTTLNGAAVGDVSGLSPLVNGMSIHAPENATPGALGADAAATTSNVATITFDVRVNPDVVDGTIISNQGFVSAVANNIADYPSDDPTTSIPNDPTRDVVGAVPLLFADKRATLQVDLGSPGVVDPGDVLRYTITVHNNGNVPATGVMLRDGVPANTTYVADSLYLNSLPVGQPDGGVSPLIAGINISSADQTPPLPGVGQGTLTAGNSAVIQFDLRVNAAVAAGTLITNQARVLTNELPDQLTDGDGNPATGPEPTVVVVGVGQQLAIVKQVAVVGGGSAVAGATLEYVVRVTNIASVPAQYVVITDDLNAPMPGYLAYVDQSATLNGVSNAITVANSLITADYSTAYGPLQPGQVAVLRFRAVINPNLPIGTRITNTGVVTWNNPPRTARASVSIDVGGIVGVGTLNGRVWHDANFNRTNDANERLLEGWSVDLYRNDRLVHSAITDASGAYRISGIAPNYINGDRYELRFVAPGAGASTAKLGRAYSEFSNDLQRVTEIVLQPGSNIQNVNLPIEPNGVVYNTIARTPVPGAVVTMLSAATQSPLPETCFYDPAQQNQVTLAYGYYRFDLNFSEPTCASGGNYLIEVTAPAVGYIAGPSQIIPPTSDASTAALSVPTCPSSIDDAIAATAQHCEVQTSEFAPPPSVRARTAGTRYHKHFRFDDSLVPGSTQIFNNHIPVDPDLQGVLSLSKVTPMLNVTRGQLVPYTITYTNVTPVPLFDITLVDRFPAGFRYVEGSARIDGVPVEPAVVGREIRWNDLSVDGNARHSIVLLLAVGAGVSEGEFVNRAQAIQSFTNSAISNEGSATVRVIPDATFDCTDVTGKVFDDSNRNGIQDSGERGLSGVRVVSARGLTVTTDSFGRFHITCAITPREGRGSNFVLKLDDRTLPSGYRSSSDQIRIQRATRGKALRFNFGASIHRVIGLDIADAVFEPGTTEMRTQWKPRLNLLMEELQKGPAVLRLSYLADVEDERLVEQRMATMKQQIMQSWQALNCCYRLTIEPEVFWRRGGSPKQAAVQATSR
ncbi:SdrD B-like domain-containing protein [Peristeroidobacter agariperforans]|uniref:SdrD B-like domain-containing protein n=1 Tax=Peristeroidobacter agariperforans TaxID=268404 RepID=UPI00101CE1C3|nr:SdrD B-like domain-containing protein [Peristeroidobacter agariperforans]